MTVSTSLYDGHREDIRSCGGRDGESVVGVGPRVRGWEDSGSRISEVSGCCRGRQHGHFCVSACIGSDIAYCLFSTSYHSHSTYSHLWMSWCKYTEL